MIVAEAAQAIWKDRMAARFADQRFIRVSRAKALLEAAAWNEEQARRLLAVEVETSKKVVKDYGWF